jgi:hypothetical protein
VQGEAAAAAHAALAEDCRRWGYKHVVMDLPNIPATFEVAHSAWATVGCIQQHRLVHGDSYGRSQQSHPR